MKTTQFVFLLLFLSFKALFPLDKNAILTEYYDNTNRLASMETALRVVLSQIPTTIPKTAQLKLERLNRAIFDSDEFYRALLSSEIPDQVLQTMMIVNKQFDYDLRRQLRRAATEYFYNWPVWHSQKKVSDFSKVRVNFFNSEYIVSNGPNREKQFEKQLSPLLGKIVWKISFPEKAENAEELTEKIRQISEKRIAEIDQYAAKGEMPPSVLLPVLLNTMMLSDSDFQRFAELSRSQAYRSTEQFLFEFRRQFIENQLRAFLKTL